MSKAPLNKNQIIIACAGSGKTTFIVDEALKLKDKKVLITTYTNENLDQIKTYLINKAGHVPPNISIVSWFSFLLQDGVRPYQNCLVEGKRIQSIYFPPKRNLYHRKDDYVTPARFIYSDKVSEFVFECNKKNKGLVINRIGKIYDYLFIDELQDFASYDLNVLQDFFQSQINTIGVCDPRQATFSTNNASKNKRFRRQNIYAWIKEQEKNKTITINEKTDCHRCNQMICDFGDQLFPNLPKTISKNMRTTDHDGIFCIPQSNVCDYVKKYTPVIIRYRKDRDTLGFPAINIGLSKGRTYDRVLIFPTKPMCEYLATKDLTKVGDQSKLYVAVTRARYSVTFVVDD